MRVIEERDVGELMDEIGPESFFRLAEVFGRDDACDAVEDVLEEVDYDDIANEIEERFIELVEWCIENRGRDPLTSDEMVKLDLSYEECRDHGIDTVDEYDEYGNVVEFTVESEDQMKLFPDIEAGLPPMKIRKAVA